MEIWGLEVHSRAVRRRQSVYSLRQMSLGSRRRLLWGWRVGFATRAGASSCWCGRRCRGSDWGMSAWGHLPDHPSTRRVMAVRRSDRHPMESERERRFRHWMRIIALIGMSIALVLIIVGAVLDASHDKAVSIGTLVLVIV